MVNILETRNFAIYPFYDVDVPQTELLLLGSLYKMKETSGFSIIQLHRCIEQGQSIKLSFKARKIVQNRPTNHNNLNALFEILEGGNSGGQNIWTNYIIV